MNQTNKKQGFTLIELMLAMGFVSVLLLAIAMTVIQIGNIYNRGLTLKDVNQTGRSLASELERSINQSANFDLTVNAGHYIVQQAANGVIYGGRLCIGQYSYVWNYGFALDPSDPLYANRNKGPNGEDVRFVKLIDPNASYCINKLPLKSVTANAVEILNVSEHNLAIHNFSIKANTSASDGVTGQQMYVISFILGTNDQTALTGARCLLPGEVVANKTPDPSYCFVNRFDIVARAGNVVQ